MTDDLPRLLDDVGAALEALQRGRLLAALQPGYEAEQTRAALGQAGFTSCPQIEVLYAWHNGTNTAGVHRLGDISLFPGFYLLSLEDALANYQAFKRDRRWKTGWLPVLANGGGDFYVCETDGPVPGAVRLFMLEETEHLIEFLTIRDMVNTFATAFKQGLFFIDHRGYLEMDDLRFAALAAVLNPEVPSWAD